MSFKSIICIRKFDLRHFLFLTDLKFKLTHVVFSRVWVAFFHVLVLEVELTKNSVYLKSGQMHFKK